jgi:hypothetical protein
MYCVKRAVEIFRSRILKRIDDMEEKLMLEVNAANSKIVAETQEEMKAVEQYMSQQHLMALFSRMYDVRLLCMIYSIYRHDRSSKNQEPYLCDQNRTD